MENPEAFWLRVRPLGALMSYEVIWSDSAKQKMDASFQSERSPDRRAWIIQMVRDIITRDVSQYPRDGAARPGEHATGELRVGGFRVRYDIQLDREVALITDID